MRNHTKLKECLTAHSHRHSHHSDIRNRHILKFYVVCSVHHRLVGYAKIQKKVRDSKFICRISPLNNDISCFGATILHSHNVVLHSPIVL